MPVGESGENTYVITFSALTSALICRKLQKGNYDLNKLKLAILIYEDVEITAEQDHILLPRSPLIVSGMV